MSRSRFAIITLSSVALACLLAAVVRAADDGFQADRPDFSESPNVVPVKAVQLEMGWTRDEVPGLTLHSVGEGLLRVGLAPRFEFRLGLPTWFHGGDPGDFEDGFGDMTLGGKWFLGEGGGTKTRFGLVGDLDLPGGSSAYRTTAVDAGLTLAAERPCGPLDLSANLVGSNEDDSGERVWRGAASLSAGFDITSRLGGYAEWYEFYADATRPSQYLNAGGSIQLTPHLQVDLRAGLGWAGAEDEKFVGAGGSIRW